MLTSAREWLRSPSKRLRLVIILFGLSVLGLLWSGLAYERAQSTARAVDDAKKETANLAIAFRENVSRTFNGINHLTQVIAAEYRRDPAHYRLPDWIDTSPVLAGVALQVGIIGADGYLKDTNLPAPGSPLDLSDRAHFRYHLDPTAGQPYISVPVRGRVSHRWSIQVSRRLENPDGSFGGVVVVSVDPDFVSSFYNSIDLGRHGSIILVGRDGIVRARRSGTDTTIGQNLEASPMMQKVRAGLDHGTYIAPSSVDGVERIYSFAVVPDFNLIVSAGLGKAEVLGALDHEQRFDWLLGILLSIVLVVPIALLLREESRGREREIAIAAQASLLRTVLDVSPAAVWVKNEVGQFEMINDTMAHILGRPREEIIGQREDELLAGEAARGVEGWDEAALLQPGVTIGGSYSTVAGGSDHHLLTFRRRCDVSGRSLLVGAAVDVISLHRAEAALRAEVRQREAAEAELRQAQKMEAIGKLTGGVAHDFNNLLTSVLGNLELARRRIRDTAVLRLLANAERAAERGAELIQHLLAFARKQRLESQPVDLNALLRGMNDLLAHALGSAVRVETRLADGLWPAFADATQVEAAILNIAINARDAMPSGGVVTITTGNIESGSSHLPSELPAEDYVLIEVSDSGIGMSQEILAKAFDPFFTTKAVGKGSGLGLSQVYGMARQSNGTATLRSIEGRGTTVSLYLPRAPTAAGDERASKAMPALSRHGGACILVVDDDGSVRDFVTAALCDAGHRVLNAAGGREALDMLAAQRVDLLVADILMPEMTGTELARVARERQPELTVLFITGYAELPAGERPDGAPLLMKPFRPGRLIAEVDGLLDARSGRPAADLARPMSRPA